MRSRNFSFPIRGDPRSNLHPHEGKAFALPDVRAQVEMIRARDEAMGLDPSEAAIARMRLEPVIVELCARHRLNVEYWLYGGFGFSAPGKNPTR